MIHWNPDPDLFSIGFFHVRWYSLMFLIGFSVGYQLFLRMARKEGKPEGGFDNLLTAVVLGTIIGARLGHCLFYEPEYFLANPLEILKVWQGGLASHGGTVGVIVVLWWFSRKHKEFPLLWLLDRMSIPVALTAGLIRLGNLMNSEIIGRPTKLPWGFVFEKVDAIPRHPTQIYESLTYFCLLIGLVLIYRKKKPLPPGLLFGISMIVIFCSRIGWEFLKENQVPFEAGMALNMGQWLSIPFVLLGLYLVVRARGQKAAVVD